MPFDLDASRKSGFVRPLTTRRLWACLPACLGTAACLELTGPDEGEPVTPKLSDLSARYFETTDPDEGVLVIRGGSAMTFKQITISRSPP